MYPFRNIWAIDAESPRFIAGDFTLGHANEARHDGFAVLDLQICSLLLNTCQAVLGGCGVNLEG